LERHLVLPVPRQVRPDHHVEGVIGGIETEGGALERRRKVDLVALETATDVAQIFSYQGGTPVPASK
jgi:hypothetical protein